MRAIILAAGFGTRMGALGKTCPKGLMPIGDRTVLDALTDDLLASDSIGDLVLVTNATFAAAYGDWIERRGLTERCTLIDDGATSPENRLGATGDLELVLGSVGRDAALVLASDNLFTFSVAGLADEVLRSGRCSVCVLEENDPEGLRSSGCVRLDGEGRIVAMVEKPEIPPSNLLVPPIYGYTREALHLVPTYLAEGGNPDAPGHLCAWLCGRMPVYAWRPGGSRLDIGSPEKLVRARAALAARESANGGGA